MRVNRFAVSVVGASLLAIGCAENKHEEKMSIDTVPPAVREGINRQLNGGTVKEIERETKDGRPVYEVEVMRGDKKVEFKVAEDGSAVGTEKSKAADKEDEEHEEDEAHGKAKADRHDAD